MEFLRRFVPLLLKTDSLKNGTREPALEDAFRSWQATKGAISTLEKGDITWAKHVFKHTQIPEVHVTKT